MAGVTFGREPCCLDTRYACHQASSPLLGYLWQWQAPRGHCHSLLGHDAGVGGAGPQPHPRLTLAPGEAVDQLGVSNIRGVPLPRPTVAARAGNQLGTTSARDSSLRLCSAHLCTAGTCGIVGWEYQRVGELYPVRAANLRWLADGHCRPSGAGDCPLGSMSRHWILFVSRPDWLIVRPGRSR